MPPQLREIEFHVQNHATQWHGFQHEIQLQEIGVAWIKMTHKTILLVCHYLRGMALKNLIHIILISATYIQHRQALSCPKVYGKSGNKKEIMYR